MRGENYCVAGDCAVRWWVSSAAAGRSASPDHPSPVAVSRNVFFGATISVLRPSIDHRTALPIASPDNADAESMIRAIPLCARFTEKQGNSAPGNA
jgi:hypothetical protein